MVSNHEYTNEELMFPTDAYDEETVKRIAMASHGMSVVELAAGLARSGSWTKVRSRRTRPTTAASHRRPPLRRRRPGRRHQRMRTTADPRAARARHPQQLRRRRHPVGHGATGEENINQYFEAAGPPPGATPTSYARYGISARAAGGNWKAVDPRFDLDEEPHEPFRFGWIVEVDPYDKKSTPRKHTMLGRFKHEGANVVVVPDGHVGGLHGRRREGRVPLQVRLADTDAHGRGRARATPQHAAADQGHAVRRRADRRRRRRTPSTTATGTGSRCPATPSRSSTACRWPTSSSTPGWRPTTRRHPHGPSRGRRHQPGQRAGLRLPDQQHATGAPRSPSTSRTRSPLAWTAHALDGPLTPTPGNRNGYVLELTEDGDTRRADFDWRLMLVCGDPEAPETYFAGYPKDKVSPISCPDNVAFDAVGNLWVSTDGNKLGSNDGLFRVPIAGPGARTGAAVPDGAGRGGDLRAGHHRDRARCSWPCSTRARTTAATFETPASTWPNSDFPRPSVVAAYQP